MRLRVAIAIVCLGSCSLGAIASGQESTISLSFRPAAQAEGTTIQIGDVVLVRSSDASAAISVGQGELTLQSGPGPIAVISRQDVVSAIGRIDSHLLARLKWTGSEQISVGKPGRWLESLEYQDGAKQALGSWLNGKTKSFALRSRVDNDRKWVEADAKVQYLVPSTSKVRSQMPVQVDITDRNGKSRSFPVWFSVSAAQDVWVLSRDLNAGEIISQSDLVLRSVDIAALDGDSLLSDSNIGDQMMVSPANAGTVLLQSQIKPRPAVMVGERVSVKVNMPMIQLETVGLALQSAEKGRHVLIRNARSGETLTARVMDRDVVEVVP